MRHYLPKTYLLGIVVWCILAFSMSSCSTDTVYCCAGKDNDLVTLLEQEGYRVVRADGTDELLEMAPEHSAVLLLNPLYPKEVRHMTAEQMAKIREKDLRVFAEFATPLDKEPELYEAQLERVVVTDSISPELKPMDLLSVNRGYYFREEGVKKPALSLAVVAGFDSAFYGLENTPNYPLAYRDGNVWFSTSMLSDFAKVRFLPEFRWQAFWEHVMGDLMRKEVRFTHWLGFVRPSYSETARLPEDARRESVAKGVEWFFNGHFLVHPSWRESWVCKYQGDGSMPVGPELPANVPDGDGSLGVLEGHCSAIYADGRQAYRYWMRDDVQGEASMTFAIAGELLGNNEYKKIASNIVDYSIREFRAGPRNNPQSPTYGLLS